MVFLLQWPQHTKHTHPLTAAFKRGRAYGTGKDNSRIDFNEYMKRSRLKGVVHIFDDMEQQDIRGDSYTYAYLLQECLNDMYLLQGKLVHSHMIHAGFKADVFLETKLVIMYTKCGSLADARRVLDEMRDSNVISWTALITVYSRHGHDKEALSLFYEMQRAGIDPNQFTFASVLPACANLGALEHGRKIHQDIIRSGFMSNVFVGSALIDMYGKCGSLEDARDVFDKMAQRNVVTWNSMILGYAENCHIDEAVKLFERMPERSTVSWNLMIAVHAQNGDVEEAADLFVKMPRRDVVSWNSMITGYVQNGRVEDAAKLFHGMPERNVVSWNSMIAGYTKNGNVDAALKLFQKMPQRNLVSWNTMIAGNEQSGRADYALQLFQQMKLTGVKPNSVTFVSVLHACANLTALEHGKEAHEDTIRTGLHSDAIVSNALVDMYAKCGYTEDARKIFDKMSERITSSWNVMIMGYAINGCGKEALQLFEQMQLSGGKANQATFVGVLSACCHAGLVDDGYRFFDRMSRDYHITPLAEHYCCMVDLLGRAGCLKEAENFICKMPVKPTVAVWRSLLSGCRIYNNVEIGERVAECLFVLDPNNAAHYVLLSNIYATAGKWDDVQKVRNMMKDRGVKKMPAYSSIKTSNKVYTFQTGD